MRPVALGDDERHEVLAAAVAAPSMHNTQPWHIIVDTGRVEVVRDLERGLPVEDAALRGMHLACGAAAFNAYVALNHLGFAARMHALPPATALGGGGVALDIVGRGHDEALEELYAAIPRRRTNRFPFEDEPVEPPLLDALRAAAHSWGAALRPVTARADRQRLLSVVHTADDADRADRRRTAERRLWIAGAPERDDGVPAGALGARPDAADVPVRDLAPGLAVSDRSCAHFERSPAIAVLGTRRDDTKTWLRAGAALQHVLLLGTARGAAFSFTHQPLEYPLLRPRVALAIRYFGHPQMVLRLGYPTVEVAATPRRSPQLGY